MRESLSRCKRKRGFNGFEEEVDVGEVDDGECVQVCKQEHQERVAMPNCSVAVDERSTDHYYDFLADSLTRACIYDSMTMGDDEVPLSQIAK